MKKILFFTLLSLMVTSSAFAFSLTGGYTGDLLFKFSDRGMGNLIWPFPAGTYGNAGPAENAWGIFKITSIVDLYDNQLWFDGKDGEELTGMYYDIRDDYWAPTGTGVNVQAVKGHIDVYLDNTPDYTPAGGPGARGVGLNNYPTVTDGSLFLGLDLVPGIKFGNGNLLDDHITYDNILSSTNTPFTGDGAFYGDVTGGAYGYLFDSNAYTLVDDSLVQHNADVFGQFDATAPGAFGWLVNSQDPIGARMLPEPSTMLLFGMGIVGLATRIRRKKVA